MKRTSQLWFALFVVVAIAGAMWLIYRSRSPVTSPTSNGTLNVLNWDFYIGENTIPSFQDRYRIFINYEKYANNEEALEKIMGAPGAHDIVFPSNYMIKILREAGKLQRVDPKRISNLTHIDPAHRHLDFDPEEFCPPYLFGTTGFAINRSFVSGEQLPVDKVSWASLKNPAFKNRVVILDDMRFVLGSVLMELGHDPNSISPEEIDQAVSLLREIKPNIRAFTADTGKDALLKGDAWIAYAWSGDTLQVQSTNPNVQYVIPSYGSLRFQDGICLLADAPNQDNAYLFINHLLDPEVSAEITNYTHYGNANATAKNFIKKEILENPASFPSPETMQRLHFIRDIGDGLKLYQDAWERVKS